MAAGRFLGRGRVSPWGPTPQRADTHAGGVQDRAYALPRKSKVNELATRPVPSLLSSFAAMDLACVQRAGDGTCTSRLLVGFMGIGDIQG